MATPEQRDAYVELRGLIEEISELQQRAARLAHDHQLVYEQRYLDAPKETIDPERLIIEQTKWGARHRFKDDDVDYPGQYVMDSWMPSSLC